MPVIPTSSYAKQNKTKTQTHKNSTAFLSLLFLKYPLPFFRPIISTLSQSYSYFLKTSSEEKKKRERDIKKKNYMFFFWCQISYFSNIQCYIIRSLLNTVFILCIPNLSEFRNYSYLSFLKLGIFMVPYLHPVRFNQMNE